MVRNIILFYGEELLAPHPTSNLDDLSLSAVRYYLFNIFSAALNVGGRSSIHNLRTRHAMVTGTHLSWLNTSILSKTFSSACSNITTPSYMSFRKRFLNS